MKLPQRNRLKEKQKIKRQKNIKTKGFYFCYE